jgi:lipoprotein Spr
LDAEVEQVPSIDLLTSIDQWMGTPYRMGGTTKAGIDCSGFVQTIYAAVYKINIPRTSKDQYNFCHAIPYDELKTGDLVFFNTTGGVSHVGIYLQNNKFVHAFSSGVNISDLNDEYYAKRFIGAGRIDH